MFQTFFGPEFIAVLNQTLRILGVVWDLVPLWAPIVLGIVFWKTWITYRRTDYLADQEKVLLEIKIPRSLEKTPKAMEIVLEAMQQTGGEATFIDRWWKGGVRAWFSLELVSIGGDIHFFIWTWDKYRDLIEHNIYSQYPDVEIHDVSDYTHFLEYDREKHSLWGCEFALTKDDPYPIKTYVDYGIDKAVKEEEKVDPLTPVIEYLGSIGPGEQVWIQILVRAHKKKIKPGHFFKKYDWKEQGEQIINDLLQRDPDTKTPKKTTSDSTFSMGPKLTKEEENIANAIHRAISKNAFDTGVRGIYIADEDKFKGVRISGLIGSVRQYSSNTLNGFKPTRGLVGFDYPWQDIKEIRQNRVRRQLFDAYRKRSYFYPPYKRPPFILNTEELATMYHFPDNITQTPTLQRIESKKAEAPTNLPT